MLSVHLDDKDEKGEEDVGYLVKTHSFLQYNIFKTKFFRMSFL